MDQNRSLVGADTRNVQPQERPMLHTVAEKNRNLFKHLYWCYMVPTRFIPTGLGSGQM